MRYKVSRPNTSTIITQLIFISLPLFVIIWTLISVFSGGPLVFFWFWEFSWFWEGNIILDFFVLSIAIIVTIALDTFLYLYLRKLSLGKALSNGYRRSIREALQTEHPEGVAYILENILKELDRFGLNLQPERISYNKSYGGSRSVSTSISDVKGFPNRTNLREVINMAQTLSEEWSNLNLAEKGQAMGEIRARIQAEDMLLSWERFSLKNKYNLDVYWFSYTEEDHRNNTAFSNPNPPTLPPNPTPLNSSQPSSFEEWINQNPVLQHFSYQEQREAYQKYLKSMGVQILSFEEWLSQNSDYQLFSEEEQQQEYQKYLDLLGGNS